MLSGYKTYIVAFGIVVAAVVAFVNGQADLGTAVMQALTGLGFAGLRAGVATDAAK